MKLPTLASLLPVAVALTTLKAGAGEHPLEPGSLLLDERIQFDASENPLEWNISMNPLMPWVEGTIVAPVSIGLDVLVKEMDFYLPLNIDVRKGRWGIDTNFFYYKASISENDLPGSFIDRFDLGMKILSTGVVGYRRVAEWDDGESFFDVGAGARVMWLDANIGFSEDDAGIAATSARLADQTLNRISRGVKTRIGEELDALDGQIPRESSRGSNAGPVQDAIEGVIRARAAEAAAAAGSRAKEKLGRVRERAEARLANRIDRAVREKIPENAGGDKGWVDPIIMTRLRKKLGDKLFVQLYGDIGGFGVSSDITWKAEASFLYEMRENFLIGLGFRYFRIDYQDDAFIFDVDAYGPVISATWRF